MHRGTTPFDCREPTRPINVDGALHHKMPGELLGFEIHLHLVTPGREGVQLSIRVFQPHGTGDLEILFKNILFGQVGIMSDHM